MRILALLLAVVSGFAGCSADEDRPAFKRLNSLIEAINSKDRAKASAMIKEEFDPAMFKGRTADEWTAMTLQIASNVAPLKMTAKKLDLDYAVVAEFTAAKGEMLAIRVDCNPAAPHKIIGIRIDESADRLMGGSEKKDYSNYKTLDELAKRAVEDSKVPGIAIAVFKDDRLHTGRAGVRKLGEPDPIGLNDRWNIGSNAKSMTCVLIATLIENGKLKWDSKLGDLLPDIPMKESYRGVTVEQLMQHIGGVRKDMTFTGPDVERIVAGLKDRVQIRSAYAKVVLNSEPIGAAGQKFDYSNAGYSLLGHIAERIEKKPFETLISERVFNPLGLKTAMVGQPGVGGMPSSEGQPHGHFAQGGKFVPGKLSGPINAMMAPAGGGVACSAEDLARYVEWHMKGDLGEKVALLKPETVKRLHTILPRAAGERDYAAGWVVGSHNGKKSYSHMGSDGSFMAIMTFVPDKKLAVVVIVNAGVDGPVNNVAEAILNREIGS